MTAGFAVDMFDALPTPFGLDRYEKTLGERQGRPRVKLIRVSDMIAAANRRLYA